MSLQETHKAITSEKGIGAPHILKFYEGISGINSLEFRLLGFLPELFVERVLTFAHVPLDQTSRLDRDTKDGKRNCCTIIKFPALFCSMPRKTKKGSHGGKRRGAGRKKANGRVLLTVRVNRQLRERLQAKADAEKRTLTEVVEMLLEAGGGGERGRPRLSTSVYDEQDWWDQEVPEQFKEHLLKAFAHKAALGPLPGKYCGPEVPPYDPFARS